MSEIVRNQLTTFDKELIDSILSDLTFKQQVAVSVKKQGWISDKQRDVLSGANIKKTIYSAPRYSIYDNYGDYGDYDDEMCGW